jgi:nicotinate-nucleotide adenylyltransferase
MALHFIRRAPGRPARLGILPGAFNPPTVAHLALARAALPVADEVLFVLPRAFPHKPYEGAAFPERVVMLEAALAAEPRCSIAAADAGLFIDIARDCRAAYGPAARLSFLCGRDAAERIVDWDYGDAGAIGRMLDAFDLLVACRSGGYEPPAHLRGRVETLVLEGPLDSVSATELRRRIAAGEPWEYMAPPAIVPLVRRIYGRP